MKKFSHAKCDGKGGPTGRDIHRAPGETVAGHENESPYVGTKNLVIRNGWLPSRTTFTDFRQVAEPRRFVVRLQSGFAMFGNFCFEHLRALYSPKDPFFSETVHHRAKMTKESAVNSLTADVFRSLIRMGNARNVWNVAMWLDIPLFWQTTHFGKRLLLDDCADHIMWLAQ